jgi:hypothetical protein
MANLLPTPDTLLTLSQMRDGHWWQLDPPPSAFWQDLQRLLRRSEQRPDGVGPDSLAAQGVIGRPSALAALPFHRNALAHLCRCAPQHPQRHRLAYHADWLFSLLSEESGPKVSVIIPVFNRADTIAEAVGCCLEQTYSNLEIVVIDDGSSEDIAGALQPVRDRIRLLRHQINRGAGVARNVGITHASGSLLHFLDADDLLEPDTIARKIQALRIIPDADLVFSGARQTGRGEHERGKRLRFLDPPNGDANCPTNNLMTRAATGYPFLTSTVLLPRHLLRETGPFDTSLRHHEDTELFFRLALKDVKAIGIGGLPTHRRVSARSLSASVASDRNTARLRARCLVQLAAVPHHWQRHSPEVLDALLQADVFEALALDQEQLDELPRYRRSVFHTLRRMRRHAAGNGQMADQLGDQLHQGLSRLRQENSALVDTALYRDLSTLVDP